MESIREENFIGCMLGVAVGDARGQPVEGYPPERIRKDFGEVRDFMPGDTRLPLPLTAGQWTDDTQMTLDIARSILRCGRWILRTLLANSLWTRSRLESDLQVANNLRKAGRLLSEQLSTADALAQIGTTGWVVHTVAADAYCFSKTQNEFERSVIDAVMGVEDADTTAAVTGAISGAYNGEQSIPLRWRANVERGDEIRGMGQDLWRLLQVD